MTRIRCNSTDAEKTELFHFAQDRTVQTGTRTPTDGGGAVDVGSADFVWRARVLLGGQATIDAAVLEFDIVSTYALTLGFQYIFASEEYPQYIGPFNDPMALFVSTNFDGTKWINSITNDFALVPETTNVSGSVNNINGGCIDDAAHDFDLPINPQYYVDNHAPQYNFSAVPPYSVAASVFNIQYDGLTVLLTA